MNYKPIAAIILSFVGINALLYTDYQWHLSYNQQIRDTQQRDAQQAAITQTRQKLSDCITKAQSWAALAEAGQPLAYVASAQNQEAVSIQACQTEYPIPSQ